MLYFIPAWYRQDTWSENEQCWHKRRMHTEFDDTVKQVQLFHRNATTDFQMLLLSFTPNFRHFLHRQGVFHAKYWSCFDAMQEIGRTKAMPLSYHDINWPQGVEMVYTPYAVIVYLHGAKYGKIEFGEDGNPIQIDMFQNEVLCRRNIYDDRGFVASTILYENGTVLYQDYLMENGVWKLRQFALDGHVEVNQECSQYLIAKDGSEHTYRYIKKRYEGMGEVIQEVLHRYLMFTSPKDIFCVAMHRLNAELLQKELSNKRTILSFFEERYDFSKEPEITDMVANANYVVTDSAVNTEKVRRIFGKSCCNLKEITPYDSRVDFGISPQLSVRNILVPVDQLEEELFEQLILQVAAYLLENSYARVHLFTRDAREEVKEQLLDETRKILAAHGFPEEWVFDEEEEHAGGNGNRDEDDGAEQLPILFFVEQCVDELEVSKCMRKQRVIVDLRKQPELFLQISAISMGIPQIVTAKTQYVEHGQNGVMVNRVEEIGEQLHFYLDGLNNWNEAVVGCYEIGQRFTTKVLLDAWSEVLRTIG